MPVTFTVTVDDIQIKYLRIAYTDISEDHIKVIVPFDFLTDRNETHKSSETTFWERVHPNAPANQNSLQLSEEDTEWLKDFIARCKKSIMDREGIT